MKRALCLILALVLIGSLGMTAFAEEILFCRMCGKQIPADSKVCQYCGEAVIHTDTPFTTELPAEPSATAEAAVSTASKSAPSPATAEAAAVPGPFNTVLGGSNLPGRVRVTKSPTSESVPYGGSCLFIAHADNATTITWYIANSDTSMIVRADEAPNKISGLYVSGAHADTLSLSNIPSWMNGCQVQACFEGEGGPVYTEIARIWTYEPEPEYTWWDWFWYLYHNDPYLWNCLFGQDDRNPPPPDVDRAVTLDDGTSVAPPVKPGEYVDPAVVVGHTHEPGSSSSASESQTGSQNNSQDSGPSAPGPAPATISLPDPSAGADASSEADTFSLEDPEA